MHIAPTGVAQTYRRSNGNRSARTGKRWRDVGAPDSIGGLIVLKDRGCSTYRGEAAGNV